MTECRVVSITTEDREEVPEIVGQGGWLQLNFAKWQGYLDGGGRSILAGGRESTHAKTWRGHNTEGTYSRRHSE